jgi:hypothetical protein
MFDFFFSSFRSFSALISRWSFTRVSMDHALVLFGSVSTQSCTTVPPKIAHYSKLVGVILWFRIYLWAAQISDIPQRKLGTTKVPSDGFAKHPFLGFSLFRVQHGAFSNSFGKFEYIHI